MPERKTIVCIFAHPDDEAFGPSGTIANWSQKNDVYLICVTDGQNKNADTFTLSTIRKKELLNASKILGVRKVFFLNYKDGELRNNIYHNVALEIERILNILRPEVLLTFELRGISGHIDHIFVSMVTSFLYRKLKYIKKIYYFASPKIISTLMKNYYIYFPEGFDRGEVDHIESVSKVWREKIKAVKSHKSQTKDGKLVLNLLKKIPTEEYFFVKEKK